MDPRRAAVRKARAQEKSEAHAKSIAEKTDVDASVLRVKANDRLVREVYREEALAGFLEELDAALPGAHADPLEEKTVPELKQIANEEGVEGAVSQMNKGELVGAINEARGA